MTLDSWHKLAVENDETITRLRRELAEAIVAREELFKVVIEEEPSVHKCGCGRLKHLAA